MQGGLEKRFLPEKQVLSPANGFLLYYKSMASVLYPCRVASAKELFQVTSVTCFVYLEKALISVIFFGLCQLACDFDALAIFVFPCSPDFT